MLVRTIFVYSYQTTCSYFHPHWLIFCVCSRASCSSVQVSWLFYFISPFLGCISPELGNDSWVSTSFLRPLFPPGLYLMVFYQADPLRGQSLLSWSSGQWSCCAASSHLHSDTQRSWVQSMLPKNQLWICITHHRKKFCEQSVLVLPVELHGCWCNVGESSKIFGAYSISIWRTNRKFPPSRSY